MFMRLKIGSVTFYFEAALFCVSAWYHKRTRGSAMPSVVFLGDFLQLRTTAQLSLIDDTLKEEEEDDENLVHCNIPREVQHAQQTFTNMQDVFEL